MSVRSQGGSAAPAAREPPVRRRPWFEVRWRQARNAPYPVVRAVLSSLGVAAILATIYLAYDVALSRGAALPGGDLRLAGLALYVLAVTVVGALITYLVVPLPSGGGSRTRRSGWSAALGLFAALPVAYLVLVIATQVVRPLLG